MRRLFEGLLATRGARITCGLWLAIVAIGAATRIALALSESSGSDTFGILWRGAWTDAWVGVLMLTPIALFLAWYSAATERPRLRFVLLASIGAAVTFGAFVEYFFFEEFSARFNHVALDYLLFPGEVAGNVWESYPVPVYLALAAAAGVGIAFCIQRSLRGATTATRRWPARLVNSAIVLSAAGVALCVLRFTPTPDFGNRASDEIASNGLVQLTRAWQTAELDYQSYYRTVTQPDLERIVKNEFGSTTQDPARTFRAAERREHPLDVVVILGESFGSEFVGRLGGRKPCTPGLERWADQGLFLENVVPTGNRTVRGLEGVLCSFVPLPGDSVWKRDKSDDVASIARVLKQQGYRTEFVYGGDGAFDGMKSFALRNGWDQFHEDSLIGTSSYPKDAFRTIWGVADEYMFDKLLDRQRAAAHEGKPLFATALTVSNHKPYLTPDTKDTSLRGQKLWGTAWQGALLLGLTWLGWRFAPRSLGLRTKLLATGAVWLVFLLQAWADAQPRDTRENAVRYADRALAQYFERARAEGLLDHTVVLFVGDHGARVYGSGELPAASYRVPALILAPGAKYAGRAIPRLCSQVDLAPTVLSIAGVDYEAPFFGKDLLAEPADGPGRAWLIHNRNIGLLTDETLTVLGLRKTTTFYRRPGRASDEFERVSPDPALWAEADRAAATFQEAALLYDGERYRLPHAP